MPNNSPTRRPYNTMAILSLVMLVLFFPAAFVLGIMALNQIKQTGERGKEIAWLAIAVSGACILYIPVLLFVTVLISGIS